MMNSNIFLVTIDALRSDYIYNKNENLCPFISSLMEEGTVFENAITSGPTTRSAFPSLFTDMNFLEVKREKGDIYKISKETTFLAEEFKEEGYYTVGFSNNPHVTRIQGYDRGFDYFYDGLGNDNKDEDDNICFDMKNKIMNMLDSNFDIRFKRGKYIIGHLLSLFNERGYERFSSMFKKIQLFLDDYSKDKPLFLWTHMMEVHSPYNLPSEHFSKIREEKISNWERQWLRHKRHNTDNFDEDYLTEEDIRKIKILYKCGIREVDENLHQFFDYLRTNDFLEDGYFTITADHGENLGDYNKMTHSYIYNSVLKVPLIVYSGKNVYSIVDVFSTSNLGDMLLDLSEGFNIENQVDEYTGLAISERGGGIYAIQDEYNKIIWEFNNGVKKYFKLENGYEKKEIDYSEDMSHLETILKEYIKNVQNEK